MVTTTGPGTFTGPPPGPRPRRRGPWIALAVITALVVVLPTATGLTGKLIRRTQQREQTYPHPVIRGLDVDSDSAAVTVVAGPPGQIKVTQSLHWTTSKPHVRLRWDGDTFRVLVQCEDVGPPFAALDCGADVQLAVPPQVTVRTESSSGSTEIRGITGEVRAKANSGEIDLRNLGGPVTASTMSGEVAGHDLWSPRVDARATSGEIRLNFSRPPTKVSARANSGGVRIDVPRGSQYRVQTDATSGGQDVARGIASTTASGEIFVATTSGGIKIDYS